MVFSLKTDKIGWKCVRQRMDIKSSELENLGGLGPAWAGKLLVVSSPTAWS